MRLNNTPERVGEIEFFTMKGEIVMKSESSKYATIIASFVILLLGFRSVGYANEIQLSPQEYLQIKRATQTFYCPSDETLKEFVAKMKGKNVYQVEIKNGGRLTDAGMAVLAELPIRELRVYEGGFNGTCLGQFKELCILKLYDCDLTDEGIATLKQIPELVDLLILRAPNITRAGFAKIAEMKQLRALGLNLRQLNESWFLFQNLEALSELETLSITGQFGREVFKSISNLSNLKNLQVAQWVIQQRETFYNSPQYFLTSIGNELPAAKDRAVTWSWDDIAEPLGKLLHLERLEIVGEFVDDEAESFMPPNFFNIQFFTKDCVNVSGEFLEAMYDHMPEVGVLDLPTTLQNGKILQKFVERNPAIDICTSGKKAIEWVKEEEAREKIERGEE